MKREFAIRLDSLQIPIERQIRKHTLLKFLLKREFTIRFSSNSNHILFKILLKREFAIRFFLKSYGNANLTQSPTHARRLSEWQSAPSVTHSTQLPAERRLTRPARRLRRQSQRHSAASKTRGSPSPTAHCLVFVHLLVDLLAHLLEFAVRSLLRVQVLVLLLV